MAGDGGGRRLSGRRRQDGYGAGATNPCIALARLIHSDGLVSRDRRYTFFDLRTYAHTPQHTTTPGALAALAARALPGA
jgi:hypothetical protein